MKKIFVILAIIACCIPVSAKSSYSSPFSNNSNTYSSTGSGYTGHNYNTGSTWNSSSNGYGSHGIDSKGNSWNYNKSSGTYYNYGTGETRVHGNKVR